MKDILENIINIKKIGFNKLPIIKNTPGLVDWINNNCNPDLNIPACPEKDLFKKKIWSCIHPNEPVKCKNGNWLKYYEYTKPMCCTKQCGCKNAEALEKFKQTNLLKRGVEFPTQTQEVKDKFKKTCLDKFGVENPMQDPVILDKTQETNLNKYGFKSSLQNEDVKEKIKQTNMIRCGVNYVTQDPDVQNKIKISCINKYGRENFYQTQISDDVMKILLSPELFKNLYEKEGYNAKNILNISRGTFFKYYKLHGLIKEISVRSHYEVEIAAWLTSLNVEFEQNNRQLIKPYELDFYFPNNNLAIEFNGLYPHAENTYLKKHDNAYHMLKTKLCADKGIHLIHIFEDEWNNKKDICKSIILGNLNLITNKIAARKCQVSEITNKEIKLFLNNNHLQGHVNGKINIVLKYNNEIIAAITFGIPRYNKNVDWELLRLVTKTNVHLIGGINKLWSYFLKTYSPKSVVSYCDKRWFTGDIYQKLNFIKIKNGLPTYWYTDYENRFHRSKFTKKNCISKILQEKNNIFTSEELVKLTENIITKDILLLDKIWDCGQDTWIYKLDK